MSKSKKNKSVREELERRYGKHCFIHQGIRKLKPPTPRKAKYKGKSIASQITLHHLKPRRENRTNDNREWVFSLQKVSRLVGAVIECRT